MTYPDTLNTRLRPSEPQQPLVLDLFAGCGGLSLGFEAQGFETHGYEMVQAYVDTYNRNLKGKCEQRTLEPRTDYPQADVVIGGPPCQPFSVGGHQLGLKDARDGFPTFIECVRRVRPEIWLFENVRGLLYRNKWYLAEVMEALSELGYLVEPTLLNAKQYDVPQNRERLFVVGHRGKFRFPRPAARLVTAGEALGELAASIPPESKFLTPNQDEYVAKYERASNCITPRDLHLNRPSRTLTCRNLAGATGDMMRVRLSDGRRRRLLVREAARLQSFPDWFEFAGTETDQFNQIGNAVPPMLAYSLAGAVREYLLSSERLSPRQIKSRRLPEKQLTLLMLFSVWS